MGELVRKIGEDVPPDEPSAFLDRIENLCEIMYEDREKGADCSFSVNIKAKGKKGGIPRGLGQLINDSPHVIPLLVAEMRRREADPFRATTVEAFFESFVRWIDSLPFEDFQRVCSFVEEKANNGRRPSDNSGKKIGLCGVQGCGLPVRDTPSGTVCEGGHGGADIVEEWGVEGEVAELRAAQKSGDGGGSGSG